MKKKIKTVELTLASMFVVLIALGANITTLIPGMVVGGVPITLQTFFAILAGLILGSRLGVLTTSAYAFIGLVGIPVFAQFGAGLGTLIKPTFGFIISFILAAYVIGKIVEKKKSVSSFVIAALVGTVINYVVGTNWMYFAYKFWADAPRGIYIRNGMAVDACSTSKRYHSWRIRWNLSVSIKNIGTLKKSI